MQLRMQNMKCVAIGDGAVGKTCLLAAYTSNTCPGEYLATVFNNYSKTILVDDQQITINLWDTAGQAEYDDLRPLSYPNTNVYLLCFAIDCPTSFQNVKAKWWPEVLHHSPDTPFLLVGTKSDLRHEQSRIDELALKGMQMIDTKDAMTMVNEIGAAGYVECSSQSKEGIEDVFGDAIVAVLGHKRKNNNKMNSCCIIV